VMLDANESAGPGSAIDQLIYACGLTDAHTRATEAIEPPPTHNRGSSKIDFILVSSRLVPAITARTILPLYDGYLSDHRALIVDFDSSIFFAGPTSEVVPPRARQLTSTHPKAVSRYVKTMIEQLDKHQVVRKVEELRQQSESNVWTETNTKQWEIVDRIMEQARSYAERKCNKKKKKSGHMPWSPELKLSGQTLLYWRYRIREKTSRKTNQIMLDSLAAACNIAEEDIAWASIATICSRIKEAKIQHKRVKQDAAQLRETYMTEQAALFSALHNMPEVAARAAIVSREKSANEFRTLRQIFKHGQSNGLERLDVPNDHAVLRRGEAQPRIQLVTKERIEDVLLPHTVRRFRQHQETPFGHGDRSTGLGQDCTSADFDHLRRGTYDRDLESLSDEAREWLKHLKEKDFAAEGRLICTNISTEDWIAGWLKMRESTASAPGGHYGHYKTAAVAAKLPKSHPDHTRVLAEIYATMLSLPLKHGFAPERWKYCVDAILEKIPGKPIIEKLRIIMLYEADFNFMLKLIWGRRLVRHAELYRCLGTSNHGSRSGRQTIDALLEKLLMYEYARLTRTSLVTVDNDAKSCYDRIIKSLAMLACIGVGLPLLAASMHNKTHHGMVHSIKTRQGQLRPYSGTDDNPLEGSGQGSGASPAIWLLYSVSLLNAFREFTPGMHMSSPFETLLVVILAIFYVDDGMPGVNDALDEEATPMPVLLKQAEDATQSWERLLFASGGALELSKCFAYVIYWDLSDGRHRLIRPDEIPNCNAEGDHYRGPISLTYGNDNTRNHLVTEDPWVGRRTLGVRIAPAGNWTDEFVYRKAQSRELAIQIAGSSMARATARIGYLMMVCPKLEYPLGATQFTQQECDIITSPVLRASLSKMGYNCNMPKEVIYGPPALFGIGMHDYYIEQGIHQLLALFGHIRQDSETSRMMRIELQWCQVQAGTQRHLLAEPTDDIDYIETCWIMCIRDFLRTYGLRIDMTTNEEPVVQSLKDEFLMDAIRVRGECTATQLQKINACRMYLRVTRLSDIASADGRHIRMECLKGQQLHAFQSKMRWPRQGNPPKNWWTLWSKTLRHVFTADGSNSRLRHSLGAWTESMKTSEWKTVCAASDSHIEVFVLRDNGLYDRYQSVTPGTGRQFSVHGQPCGIVDSVPPSSVPAEMGSQRRDGRRQVQFRLRQLRTREELINQSTTFEEFVNRQGVHIQQTMQYSDQSDDTATKIIQQIYTAKQLVAGTDGGLLNDNGTFGYVWANPEDMDILAKGRGNVPGQPVSMSSTRAELCGLFAALTHVRLVTEYFHMVQPHGGYTATVYCDSKAALQRVQNLEFDGFGTTWRCRANYDMEAAIRHCIKQQTGLTIKWKWVKGHASRRKRPENFTDAEKLNEAADEMATSARSTPKLVTHTHWPEQQISLIGPYGRVSGRIPTDVRYCCTAADLLSYWQQRYGWTMTQARLVDNIGTAAASRRTGTGSAKARRIQKLRCGWLPVNDRESRSDPDRAPGCSACSRNNNLVTETVDHLFQCESTERRRAILDRFTAFQEKFREYKTAYVIIGALMTGSIAWIEGRPIPDAATLLLPETTLGHLVAQAYREQNEIGWNVLFRGFWTSTWRLAQEEALRTMRGRERQDTGEQWAAKAQIWYYDLFDLIWGLRNADEHGADVDTQRLIRISKCERAIRRLYDKGEDLPYAERHPFRDPIEDLLQQPVLNQELWISKTGDFLVKASKRARARPPGQPAITTYFTQLHL
jgi:ribonuclease HI